MKNSVFRWFGRLMCGIGLVYLICAFAPALAGEGVIEINQAKALAGGVTAGDTPGFPVTIDMPGHYSLTGSLDVPGTSDCIRIQADNVTLDLGGHTLSGNPGRIRVLIVSGHTDIVVRNGRLQGGYRGISQQSSVPTRVHVENVAVRDTEDYGILLSGVEWATVVGCTVENTGRLGIYVNSEPHTGRIAGNTVTNCRGGILVWGMRGGQIARNVVVGNGQVTTDPGIWVSGVGNYGGNLVEGNTVRASSGIGIIIEAGSDHNLIVDNVVTENGRDGIYVSTKSNRVIGNVASKNGQHGIFVVGSGDNNNLLEGNSAAGNSMCGISFSSSSPNVYRDNILLGNSDGVCGETNNIDAGGNIQ